MKMSHAKEKKVVNRFKKLLRSGMDYDVDSMYKEAGRCVCIVGVSAQRIINKYYKNMVTQEMVTYVNGLRCKHPEKINLF